MPERLKDQNTKLLAAFAGANLVVFALLFRGDPLSAFALQELGKTLPALVPATLAAAILPIVNGVIDAQTKARLVFWRWTDPLPGSRAFSELASNDHRIDLAALERKVGAFPVAARDQNTAWFRMYRTVSAEPAVAQNHREYLLTRDLACLSLLFVVTLGGIAVVQMDFWGRAVPYLAFLVSQYLIVRFAAASYGRRFVTTVLAIRSAED